MQGILGKLRLNQPVQCQGNFLPCVEGIVHEHRVANINKKDCFGIGGKLMAIHGKILGPDSQRYTFTTHLQCFH